MLITFISKVKDIYYIRTRNSQWTNITLTGRPLASWPSYDSTMPK